MVLLVVLSREFPPLLWVLRKQRISLLTFDAKQRIVPHTFGTKQHISPRYDTLATKQRISLHITFLELRNAFFRPVIRLVLSSA